MRVISRIRIRIKVIDADPQHSLIVDSHDGPAAVAGDGGQDGGGLMDLCAVVHTAARQHNCHLHLKGPSHEMSILKVCIGLG
jgi:hypothetical protein